MCQPTSARACACVCAFVLLCALAAAATSPRVLEGRVVAVKDGDSIVVLAGETEHEVRLANIDAPEHGQPWGNRARQELSNRVFGKEVRVNEVDVDRHGRMVGEVYADDVCVNCELVRGGHAWVYRRYSEDPVLLSLEAEAREKHTGLWSLPSSQHVPPWEWRRGARTTGADPASPAAPAPDESRTCGAKTYCREMSSCDEARFHLERCGLTQLDGDGDGVPCEPLCDPKPGRR